ncbi:TIGR03435 family protein [Terriglobus sp. RCC_193]|uniref:TIGR03435 family protein n=1 Tax=Terriglobus sp. RCC_193 TaxID=3239218 RepID=UPI003524DFDF
MLRFAQRLFALLAFVSTLSAVAQTPITEEPDYKPTLTFDVATIRISPPPGEDFRVSVTSPRDSSRFDATNLPVRTLLQIAYGYDAPFVNAPDWIRNTFYDIHARSDEAADARLAKLPVNEVRLEKRHAIRLLLADRMNLKHHMETRSSAIFHLVVAKSGVKMTPITLPTPADADAEKQHVPPADTETHAGRHGLEFIGTNANMQAVTSVLSTMMEAPVLDKTGLTGFYNYTLQIGRPWSAHDPDSFPDILTAVQEQLGLKLESVREPVPNLIFDNITKPTEN